MEKHLLQKSLRDLFPHQADTVVVVASEKSPELSSKKNVEEPFLGDLIPKKRGGRPKNGVFSPDFLDWYVGK